jgi:hypothetical protein
MASAYMTINPETVAQWVASYDDICRQTIGTAAVCVRMGCMCSDIRVATPSTKVTWALEQLRTTQQEYHTQN